MLGTVSSQYDKFRQPREVIVKKILEVIDTCPKPLEYDILDIGSGPGHYAEIIAKETSKTVFCIDISDEMLGYVKQRDNLVPIKRDCNKDFLLSDQLFSFIYTINFIHYIEDINHIFTSIQKMLASQGILFIATRSKEDLKKQTLGYYFPETVLYEKGLLFKIDEIVKNLTSISFNDLHIEKFQIIEKIDNERMDAFKTKAYSALHHISETHFKKGISRMDKDFRTGELISNTSYTIIWGRNL